MIEPQRVPVRPRVLSPSSGQSLLLEDEILPLIEQNARGVVWLIGGHGMGKTTALAHLAAVLPPSANLILNDDDRSQPADPNKLMIGCGIGGTIYTNAYSFVIWHLGRTMRLSSISWPDIATVVNRSCDVAVQAMTRKS